MQWQKAAKAAKCQYRELLGGYFTILWPVNSVNVKEVCDEI